MNSEKIITILIAEDQAITRFGLRCSLEAFPEFKVVAECADGMSAILQALACKPMVVLMDIGLPKVDGIKAAKEIKQALPATHIIMFTASADDELIYEALDVGAEGYCLKTVAGEHLFSAIQAVTQGATWLDPGIASKLLKAQESRHLHSPPTQPLKLSNNSELSSEQVAVLKLISGGSSLEDIAISTGSSIDNVGHLVQHTLEKLMTAAKHELIHKSDTPSHIDNEQFARPKVSESIRELLHKPQSGQTMLGDRYAIEGVLGRGGMGIVYKGRHVFMDREVAIKMLHPEFAEDEQVVKRFQTEAQTLSHISHPNLVPVFDFGLSPHREPFMVMDFHSGLSLEQYLMEKSVLSLELGKKIFLQVLDAFQAIHKVGIIHRDIKPSNIIVSIVEPVTVKLVDFGIAKNMLGAKDNVKLTMTGEVVGTPRYMSPEQCTGKDLDPRSDIYSLGCVMYEAFSGVPTFDGDSFYDMVRQHLHTEPSRLPFIQPNVNVPPELVEVIFTALKKDPSERFQTAQIMKAALEAVPA
jgi:DNA-binding NarL/FixJ family response regulator/tRNA A-37 threonylcarbamoyl transferase component Bud32